MNSTFDFRRITEEMDMDPEDILHLMNIYQVELQKDLNELEDGLFKQDWPILKDKLHKMKGDAANLCMPSFAGIFAEMEDASADKNSDCLRLQFESVNALKSEFLSAFKAYSNEDSVKKL